MIAPGEIAKVEVFCVEHGRWSGDAKFTQSGGMVEQSVRGRAKYESNQGAVWDGVAKKAGALGAKSETGTTSRWLSRSLFTRARVVLARSLTAEAPKRRIGLGQVIFCASASLR
ncbi:MAG: hypothetical protein JST92_08155 [Deltaproteobacteria bacterium]|nr:hypothetical protein [Deltaproteobacteria bacterium]